MLDMIYGCGGRPMPSSPAGKAVSLYTAGYGRSAQAVRYRRAFIANVVDQVAADTVRPRILSIASGHLREASMSKAVQYGCVDEWIAIDQDEASLIECERCYEGSAVRPIKGTVRQLLSQKLILGEFDFVYAAGLCDYLSTSVAEALILRMFELLKPGGKLMIANFGIECIDAGYMEAFMDWKLTYRDRRAIRALLPAPLPKPSNISVFLDQWKTILYAFAEKPFNCPRRGTILQSTLEGRFSSANTEVTI